MIDAAKQNIAQQHYDAAIVGLNQAAKTQPTNQEVQQLLKQAQDGQAKMNLDAQAQEAAKKRQLEYDGHMQRGKAAFSLKNYDAALDAFKAAHAVLPGEVASAQFIKDIDKAKTDASAAENSRVKNAALTQTIDSARAAIKGNNFLAATDALVQLTKLDPRHPELAKLQQELDSAKKAQDLARLKQEEQQRAERMRTLLAQARQSIAAKQFDAATTALAEAQKVIPNDPGIAVVQGELTVARKQMADTQAAATAEAERIKNFTAAMTRGRTAMNSGKYVEAIDSFKAALALSPNDPTANKALGDALAAAKPKVDPMPKKDPPKVDPIKEAYNQQLLAGRAAFAARQFDDALKHAQEALRLVPNDGEATKLLNDTKVAMTPAKKDPPKVDPMPKKDPPKVDPPKVDPIQAQVAQAVQAGNALEAQAKYADALKHYQDAQKLAPLNADIKHKVEFTNLMATGQRDLAAGKFPDAIIDFDLALKLAPNDANAKKFLQMAKEKKKQ